MSADGHNICPACNARKPTEEQDNDEELTLIEYFEIGLSSDYEFSYRYSARCFVCEYKFERNHKERIQP